jgi:REP element-mobilizing transposase RayT
MAVLQEQLGLFAKRRKDRRGGRRPRAGRKKSPTSGHTHRRRPSLNRHTPVHVTTRLLPRMRNLRARNIYKLVRRAFCFGCDQFGFRIVHYSVQGNHIHLICEANDRSALAKGVQAFKVRVARGMNRMMGRSGTVWADRYHAEQLTSPRHVRNALVYVLNNAKRHAERIHEPRWHERDWVDPCSSAAWFDGWKRECRDWVPPPEGPAPVAPARTWLLTQGWRKHHALIGTWEHPGGRA